MEGPDRSIWFVGDLDDPWVVAIAEALPREARRIDCPGDLPESWAAAGHSPSLTPSVLVLHRPTLTPTDALRLGRLRSRGDRPTRVVLCVGPQARYVNVERWARIVDVAIPEATASESVARHALAVARVPRSVGPRPRVAVVSANHELRTTLADACRSGGYPAEAATESAGLAPGVVQVWDVPMLEPDWPARLAHRARSAAVVALMGFADRATVTMARDQGASACLDLPCDVHDLIDALDRVTMPRAGSPSHEVPPSPLGLRSVRARRI